MSETSCKTTSNELETTSNNRIEAMRLSVHRISALLHHVQFQCVLKVQTLHTASVELLSMLSAGRCYGGFVGFMLDEGMVLLVERVVENARLIIATGELKIRFLKPVLTPGVVLVRGVLEGIEGRKVRVKGSVEDGTGVVFAAGESVRMKMRGQS